MPELPKITDPLHRSGQSGVSQPLNAPTISNADIRATVAISRDEIASGTTRTLNLPGGRRITVPIPSGIPDGQVIRFESQGDTASDGTTGALVLTISVVQDALTQLEQSGNENETVLSDPGSPKKQMSPPNVTESRRIGTRLRRLKLPRSRAALIIGLVLLIVLVSSGVFYFKYFNFIHKISLLNGGIENPYTPGTGGTLALNDPLSDNSLGYFWSEEDDSAGSCGFREGAYWVYSSQQDNNHSCYSVVKSFSNFAYEVQVELLLGDQIGIIFRVNDTNHTFYFFYIDGQGNYALDISNSNGSTTLKSGTNTAINTPSGQSNILGVVANGPQIDLYVNYQKIDSVTDNTFSQGAVGVAVYDNTNPTSAYFTNARVWTF